MGSDITRKLASVQCIEEIRAIPGADAIQAYRVLGWWVVDRKDAYHVGDTVIYLSIDSWVPHDLAPFLSQGQTPREYNGVPGSRLRSVKLRGQISQGLLLPMSTAFDWDEQKQLWEYRNHPQCVTTVSEARNTHNGVEWEMNISVVYADPGDDLTEMLGIQIWEAPVPAQLSGEVRGSFPSRIPRTNQERLQNLINDIDQWRDESQTWEVTEKLDGSSMTVYVHNDDAGVCSRNLNLKESNSNSLWITARRLEIIPKIQSTGRNLALQGEIVGEGIQGNPYRLQGQHFYLFDVYDIDQAAYLSPMDRIALAQKLGIDHVPVIHSNVSLTETVEQILQLAQAKSKLHANTEREGLVYKRQDGQYSFKAISDRFLLKNNH